MESGVATRKIDLDIYRANLESQVNGSALIMRPIFEAAKKKVVELFLLKVKTQKYYEQFRQ